MCKDPSCTQDLLEHNEQIHDTLNIVKKQHYYKNPYSYIEELTDEFLIECGEEIIQWNKSSLLIEGKVRMLCKKIKEHILVPEDVILIYLKTSIFEEMAKRWIRKRQICCKK